MSGAGRVLAIDLGARRLGWAAQGPSGRIHHGLFEMPGVKDPGLLYRCARNAIEDLVAAHTPGRIAFVPSIKTQARTSVAVGEALAGIQAVLLLVASDNRVGDERFHEATVRKAMLGKSNFGLIDERTGGVIPDSGRDEVKRLVLEWCADRGFDPLSHDVGDALLLLHYVLEFEAGMHQGKPTWRKRPNIGQKGLNI